MSSPFSVSFLLVPILCCPTRATICGVFLKINYYKMFVGINKKLVCVILGTQLTFVSVSSMPVGIVIIAYLKPDI